MDQYRAERSSKLRWWVYVIPVVAFLLGVLIGALIW